MVVQNQEKRAAIKAAVQEKINKENALAIILSNNVEHANKHLHTSKENSLEVNTRGEWFELVDSFSVHLWWNGSEWAAEV